MGPYLGNTGVDASVECGVWLTPAIQVGPSMPVHCHEIHHAPDCHFLGFLTENCIMKTS
jgi:hypothetical protein